MSGVLFDLHYEVKDKVGIEFEEGVVVGPVGGTVLLVVLGGSILIWTLLNMRKARQRLHVEHVVKAPPK